MNSMQSDNFPLGKTLPIPGIIVFTGKIATTLASDEDMDAVLAKGFRYPIRPAARARLGDWLVACILSRDKAADRHYTDGNGMTVLFDGYITDTEYAAGNAHNGLSGAALIADLYREHGDNLFTALRGSYTCMVLLHAEKRALLFNDRSGSRPLFRRVIDVSSQAIAPQTGFLARINPPLKQLNNTAVGEFLIRGCFYGTDTLFADVEKIPQASHITFTQDSVTSKPYWNLRYGQSLVDHDDDLIEEFDRLITQATRRMLNAAVAPTLLLSGGLDSRLMLAYLLKLEAKLPSFTYCVANSKGDDHVIARKIAEFTGLPHSTYAIDIADFIVTSTKEALAADGRVQIIDAPSNRWEHIGAQYSSMFIGDECFGWKDHVDSPGAALDMIGWWNIDVAPRISDWMKPGARKVIRDGIKIWHQRLAIEAMEPIPDNLKDSLYYRERMGNLLNGFSARRLAVAEQMRPFLDEDVIKFLTIIPIALRHDKLIARKIMQRKFSALDAFPYAKTCSVPWEGGEFVQHVARNPDLYSFIFTQLTERMDPRLAEIMDQNILRETATRFFRGETLPALQSEWWVHLPGAWRFSRQAQDRVGTLRGLLRILQINLFLTH